MPKIKNRSAVLKTVAITTGMQLMSNCRDAGLAPGDIDEVLEIMQHANDFTNQAFRNIKGREFTKTTEATDA